MLLPYLIQGVRSSSILARRSYLFWGPAHNLLGMFHLLVPIATQAPFRPLLGMQSLEFIHDWSPKPTLVFSLTNNDSPRGFMTFASV